VTWDSIFPLAIQWDSDNALIQVRSILVMLSTRIRSEQSASGHYGIPNMRLDIVS